MIPQTELAQRVAVMFNRRLNTPWSEKEVRVWNLLVKDRYVTDLNNIDVIERYYVYQRKQEKGIHRRDLYTFLNNFSGELDRARAWDEDMRERSKRKVRRPLDPEDNGEKPVDDADFKRIGELAKAELQRFRLRQGYGGQVKNQFT